MTRILITFSNPAERRIVARMAARLARRGIDVDLAAGPRARSGPHAVYARVLDASCGRQAIPIAAAPDGRDGVVRIIGAPAIVEAPAPAAPLAAWQISVGVVAGATAAVAIGLLGFPLFYPIGIGLVVAAAATQGARGLRAPRTPVAEPGLPSEGAPSGAELRIA